MGVAAASPERTVVLFDGDGSLLMHVQELETIRRHAMNILIVVMNDGDPTFERAGFQVDVLRNAYSVLL